MRYVAMAAMVIIVLTGGGVQSARATGFDVVGKEKPVCSRLVQRGVYPDTLNKLKEAFVFPKLGAAVERVAEELRAVLAQFGVKLANDPRGKITEAQKAKILEKSLAGRKRRISGKKTPSKKKPVKVPPRAL